MNENIRYCRAFLKIVHEAARDYFARQTVRQAEVGRLSDLRPGVRYFEFYLPTNERMARSVRLEMKAENAYMARALGWLWILSKANLSGPDAQLATSVLVVDSDWDGTLSGSDNQPPN